MKHPSGTTEVIQMDGRTIYDLVREMEECVGPLAGMTVCRTCILDEGDIIVSDINYTTPAIITQELRMESPLEINDEVSISTHLDGSYDANIIVEPLFLHEDRAIGSIVSDPKLIKFPRSNMGTGSLAERLDMHYYRMAVVEIDVIKLKNVVQQG